MTRIIGLTGGIGSGKTSVAKLFMADGIPVYIADDEARRLMTSDQILSRIREDFGDGVFTGDTLDRAKLAAIVFSDAAALQRLNEVVHPAVAQDFARWLSEQHAPFVVREAAILFESGSYKDCDKIITVTAPESVRIARVVNRDNVSESEVRSRMERQWTDEQKIALSDFVIENTEWDETVRKTKEIIKNLKNI